MPGLRCLVGWGIIGFAFALSTVSAADPWTLHSTAAILPDDPTPRRPDRPNNIPPIHPDDLREILRPPQQLPDFNPKPPSLSGPRSDYDPSRLYLPERNPDRRQPPFPCPPQGRWWIQADYFLGITQNDRIPALLTTGGNGVPGAAGTSILFGDENLDHPFRSGFRVEIGHWFDRGQKWGLDASFLMLESSRDIFEATSDGNVFLGRPFRNAATGVADVLSIAGPSVGAGSFFATAPISFLTADVNLRHVFRCEDHYRLEWLLGYRVARLAESLSVYSRTSLTESGLAEGSYREVEDTFRTINQFHGVQLGFAGERRFDRWFLGSTLKVGLGGVFSQVDILGRTHSVIPNAITIPLQTGFLTQASNLGRTREWGFAVAPEFQLRVGYQLSDMLRTTFGYHFFYLSRTARPGRAIDLTVGTDANGIAHPQRLEPWADFWMQGIQLGLEGRF